MATNYLQIPCQKIISGGQTGVDRGALDACLDSGFSCGGWCPAGRRAEDGAISSRYPLNETPEPDYFVRTRRNVRDSKGTLIFHPEEITGGTLYTARCAEELNRPLLTISPEDGTPEQGVVRLTEWIRNHNITILNVAGPRQSEWKEGYELSYSIISQLINSTGG